MQGILNEGAIDLLVNNAGIGPVMPIGEIEQDCATDAMKTNVLAAINIAREVAIGMKASGKGGSIVNMSSVTGILAVPYVGNCVYAAIKGGLDAVTRVMAMELGLHNIRVNFIITDIINASLRSSEVPTSMKSAVVTPLLKKATLDPEILKKLRPG